MFGHYFHEIFMQSVIEIGAAPRAAGAPLSKRERECLALAAHGMTTDDISRQARYQFPDGSVPLRQYPQQVGRGESAGSHRTRRANGNRSGRVAHASHDQHTCRKLQVRSGQLEVRLANQFRWLRPAIRSPFEASAAKPHCRMISSADVATPLACASSHDHRSIHRHCTEGNAMALKMQAVCQCAYNQACPTIFSEHCDCAPRRKTDSKVSLHWRRR